MTESDWISATTDAADFCGACRQHLTRCQCEDDPMPIDDDFEFVFFDVNGTVEVQVMTVADRQIYSSARSTPLYTLGDPSSMELYLLEGRLMDVANGDIALEDLHFDNLTPDDL